MPNYASATVEVTGSERSGFEESPEGQMLERVTMTVTYEGSLTRTGKAEVLIWDTYHGFDSYVAIERIEGTLQGRKGSFVLQHGGMKERRFWAQRVTGEIIPGSATGELEGLLGTATFHHDEEGGIVLITWNGENKSTHDQS